MEIQCYVEFAIAFHPIHLIAITCVVVIHPTTTSFSWPSIKLLPPI
jgi:hypothetical protein